MDRGRAAFTYVGHHASVRCIQFAWQSGGGGARWLVARWPADRRTVGGPPVRRRIPAGRRREARTGARPLAATTRTAERLTRPWVRPGGIPQSGTCLRFVQGAHAARDAGEPVPVKSRHTKENRDRQNACPTGVYQKKG